MPVAVENHGRGNTKPWAWKINATGNEIYANREGLLASEHAIRGMLLVLLRNGGKTNKSVSNKFVSVGLVCLPGEWGMYIKKKAVRESPAAFLL